MKQFQFKVGEMVTLKTDPEKLPRIVVTIGIRAEGTMYEVAWMDDTSWHADFELESVNE